MIRAEEELPAHQVGAILLCETDDGQQLTTCHTISSFWLCQEATSICNDTFPAITVNLREDRPDASVTRICIQDELTGEVGKSQNGSRAQALTEFVKCTVALSCLHKYGCTFGKAVKWPGNLRRVLDKPTIISGNCCVSRFDFGIGQVATFCVLAGSVATPLGGMIWPRYCTSR